MTETPASEIQNVTPSAPEAPAPPAPETPPAQPAVPLVDEAPSPTAPTAPQPAAPVATGGPPAPAAAATPPAPPAPPAPAGPLPATPIPEVVEPAPSAPKLMDAAWPFVGYQGPQPWEADNPPMLTQTHLMLSSGMAGDEVVELAGLLAYLGYGTSISAGQNPHAIYDTGVSAAVRAFCNDYGVEEDPRVRAARTDDTVGPWLWEALVRAVHKKVNRAAAEQQQ